MTSPVRAFSPSSRSRTPRLSRGPRISSQYLICGMPLYHRSAAGFDKAGIIFMSESGDSVPSGL